ncbi:MAG: hypothetical protein AABM42_02295 [Actinomycetota bacterium]
MEADRARLDLVTVLLEQPSPEARAVAWAIVNRKAIVAHESGHLAGLIMAGMVPARVVVGTESGKVTTNWDEFTLTRENAPALIKAILAGPICGNDPLPRWPILPKLSDDERGLAALIKLADIDHDRYQELVVETYDMVITPEFRELETLFTHLCEQHSSLDANQIRTLLGPKRVARYIQKETNMQRQLQHKTFKTRWTPHTRGTKSLDDHEAINQAFDATLANLKSAPTETKSQPSIQIKSFEC